MQYKVQVALEIDTDVWLRREYHLPFVPFPNLIIESNKPGDSTIMDQVRISGAVSITWNTIEEHFDCFGEWVGGGHKPHGTTEEIESQLIERGWTR